MLLLFKKSKLLRSFTVMLTGNILAQAISFLTAPIITRLYTPADFGVMTFIWSITSVISVAVCLGYQGTIILPADNSKGHLLFIFSSLCVLSVTVLTGILCWLGVDLIAWWSGVPDIRKYLWYVPVGLLILGLRANLVSLCTRFSFFKLIAVSQTILSIFTSAAKIIPGIFFGSAAIWLVAGNIIGPFFSLLFLFVIYIFFMKEKQELMVSLPLIISAGKEYIKFPKFNLPTQVVNSISQNMPVLLFTIFYSPEVIGWYGLASSILRRPVDLVVQSLSSVFLQRSAVIEHEEKSHFRNLLKTTMALLTVGIGPLLVMLFWGPSLFEILFGKGWYEAGVYGQILSPWLFFNFLTIPADQIIFVKQLLRFKLAVEVVYLIAATCVIGGGAYFFEYSIIAILIAFSTIGCLRCLVVLIVAFQYSDQKTGLVA
jgi:lipopolysaccharide exporter